MTAEEIMKAIEEMDSGERFKLLNKLLESYFDSRSERYSWSALNNPYFSTPRLPVYPSWFPKNTSFFLFY